MWNQRVRAATQDMWPNGEGRTSTQDQKTSGKAQQVWTQGGKSHDELSPCDGRWRGESPDLPGKICVGGVGFGCRVGVLVGTWDVFKGSLKKLHYPGMLLQDLIGPPAGCFYTLSLWYTHSNSHVCQWSEPRHIHSAIYIQCITWHHSQKTVRHWALRVFLY